MEQLDLLVVGSGVAGLSAAVSAATTAGMRVGVVSKAELELATTRWAQGGVAAALSGDPEEVDLHLADTLRAGVGLCDIEAVRVLVDEGPRRVQELIARGAHFDRDAAGELELAREGGHSVARVIHAGGAATGAEIERALVAAVRRTASALLEGAFATDLLVEQGRCVGISCREPSGEVVEIRARDTLLATGGAGQLFAVTTNPLVATGDGVAMAIRAGAAVADLEFFQFHPTALDHRSMPRLLLSEALRGHGALLRDGAGQRFVDELLPRDVVSRAITKVMADQHLDHVWLDATVLDHFDLRFPTIAADLVRAGLDPTVDWLPVAPAAHHQCGGVVSDLDGRTTMDGLWVAGEISCTGVHGANRLASNSLLEGMVFGARVVEAVAVEAAAVVAPRPRIATGAMRAVERQHTADTASSVIGGRLLPTPEGLQRGPSGGQLEPAVVAALRSELQQALTLHAGVLRSEASIDACAEVVGDILDQTPRSSTHVPTAELRNLSEVGCVLLAAARARTESRGAHARTDYSSADESQRVRYVVGGPE